jgi:N-acetyl-gamma-glutamyl-phosphate reductase
LVKVFVDGDQGTTGLNICERLEKRDDVELLPISPELRKDLSERKRLINSADIVFLCLPDDAAREAVSLVENQNTRLIDASTAHRTLPGWSYGFPELSEKHRRAIECGKRVAVPGCHASGFCAIIYPLVACGVLPPDYPFVCYSVTGYTGGGKKMIAEYESENRSFELSSPRHYALSQQHKHLAEMKAVCGLESMPVFSPIVADFPRGMVVSVPVFSKFLNKYAAKKELREFFAEYYEGKELISVAGGDEESAQNGYLAANKLAGADNMELFVLGNDERMLLCARFDNLGKGASGAAIQCMNIMLGTQETCGLTIAR